MTTDSQVTVWVDDWQFDCCGGPFRTGDRVTWTVTSDVDHDWMATLLGEDRAATVDFAEDHHDLAEDVEAVTGRVAGIQMVRCPVRQEDGTGFVPVPGGAVLTPVGSSRGGPMETDEGHRYGYLVAFEPGVAPHGPLRRRWRRRRNSLA